MFCSLFILIVIVFASFYIYKSKNEYKVYNLKSDSDVFDVQGIVLYNSYDLIFSINKVFYDDIYVGTDKEIKGDDVSVSLYVNDVFIEKNGSLNSSNKKINDCLANVSFSYQNKRKNNDPINIKLSLGYVDNKKEEKFIEIPLGLY